MSEVVTFEGLWDRRQMAVARANLPTIDQATLEDRQVRIPHAGLGKRHPDADTGPAALDDLAHKAWIDSVIAEWPCTTSVDLPGITSYFVVHDDDVDPVLLSHLPNLRQIVAPAVAPEELVRLPLLVDVSIGWRRYAIPSGYEATELLRNPKLVASFPRATAGAPALAALKGLERLQIRDFHYRDRADPIATLSSLRWLSLQGWRNLRALGALENLERLEMWELEIANLRAFRRAANVRRLGLAGRMDSLDGIEAFQQLEQIRFGGRAVRDLSILAALPNLQLLTLNYPDAVKDFAPIARIKSLRRLEMLLGDNTDAGELPDVAFLRGLDHLEELVLLNVNITDNRLDPLFELPSLRRLKLTGRVGPNVHELRARRPDLEIETHLVGEPAGRTYVGQIHYDPPYAGTSQWSIRQSLADALHTSTNSSAEQRVRQELRKREPGLLERVEFDTESGSVGIYATNERDISRVAEIVSELATTD